jgi:hypothetical protein
MALAFPFNTITIGGSGTNNPTDYSWTTYDNYPHLDLTRTYQRINVIIYHPVMKVNVEVTGLAVVVNGQTMTGPTDLCYAPCPPLCD